MRTSVGSLQGEVVATMVQTVWVVSTGGTSLVIGRVCVIRGTDGGSRTLAVPEISSLLGVVVARSCHVLCPRFTGTVSRVDMVIVVRLTVFKKFAVKFHILSTVKYI